jgi:hypothetical protein
MSKTIEETNKALVLDAFDALFNRRDYKAALVMAGRAAGLRPMSCGSPTACSLSIGTSCRTK